MTHHRRSRRLFSGFVIASAGVGLVAAGPRQAAASPLFHQAPRVPAAPAAPAAPGLMDMRLLPAMQAAGSAVGTPYRWGGSGPGGFDCSGLVLWSFARAGIPMPRNTVAQQAAAFPVSEGDLVPGDLIFYGAPAYHVGIYIGQGRMIHAPRPGDVVKVAPVRAPGFGPSGFGRVK